MRKEGIVGLIIKCLMLCGIAAGLSHCAGEYYIGHRPFDDISQTQKWVKQVEKGK